ncbi:tagatose-bisphosphate aldolase [Candidatus Kaiserbacteria bacterium CG10_big_fil_rev_8_21_14_0_10_59_10]|uniref:Tagatose-bisphosphate aldolase n=1 Tax=Candidatus Kaiserbacteria bacterium CG10_big_fil_rev_8_21_14_0_10_59_10 TaxID=1974612 RepID=A0A2H0U8M3_9BACT|nr:MAG: tagatose-bisphosphate aldolase [Candidatus Kaiserbacteria bacterium CG10_big_fil_rev_8_21_14_0_10_59_10]
MVSLREAVGAADEGAYALGHFNISDSNQFNAIVAAAKEAGMPVLVGVSEGEMAFLGRGAAVALARAAREDGLPVFLNADHVRSLDSVSAAIDAGFDSVIFDGSHLPLEENIRETRRAVEYARKSGRDVLVEGELGQIGISSKLLDAPPEDMDEELTDPDTAARFVRETAVDLLAPAVGTMHGRLKSGASPALDIPRIERVRDAAGVPLVLHGGSGSTDADFREAARAGCAIIHVNTDIRIAYRAGIEEALKAAPEEIAPYKFLAKGVEGVRAAAEKHIRLFAGR